MKPSLPCPRNRHDTSPSGGKVRVFTSLYGASEDILNHGYRRMLVNACFWALGLEDAIKPNMKVDFVGVYHPNTFANKGYAPGAKPSVYAGFRSPIPAKSGQ